MCVSTTSTLNKMDAFAQDFDAPVLAWKTAIENTLKGLVILLLGIRSINNKYNTEKGPVVLTAIGSERLSCNLIGELHF